jgi:transcriptional regulator with XRE-family HTH domain
MTLILCHKCPIARIESGKALPSMKTLTRYAKVLNMRPDVRFVPQA